MGLDDEKLRSELSLLKRLGEESVFLVLFYTLNAARTCCGSYVFQMCEQLFAL
jgi:endonuclease III-like uncharacterized protein